MVRNWYPRCHLLWAKIRNDKYFWGLLWLFDSRFVICLDDISEACSDFSTTLLICPDDAAEGRFERVCGGHQQVLHHHHHYHHRHHHCYHRNHYHHNHHHIRYQYQHQHQQMQSCPWFGVMGLLPVTIVIKENLFSSWFFESCAMVRCMSKASSAFFNLHIILAPTREASETGLPMVRPLFLQFPDDPQCQREEVSKIADMLEWPTNVMPLKE